MSTNCKLHARMKVFTTPKIFRRRFARSRARPRRGSPEARTNGTGNTASQLCPSGRGRCFRAAQRAAAR